MNDLFLRLVWLSLQVTGVILFAFLLSSRFARLRPDFRATTCLTALVAIFFLFLLALVPLPSWWGWDTAQLLDDSPANRLNYSFPEEQSANQPIQPSPPATLTLSLRLREWVALLNNSGSTTDGMDQASDPNWVWFHWLLLVLPIGIGLGLSRLLIGVWMVRRMQSRGHLVEDPELWQLLEELLIDLGIPVDIQVRETHDLTTAAVVGWKYPTLLLSSDWRHWTPTQLRAVLAHELAHVARWDFVGWLMARLNVALLFWHPLVHWLASHYQLQQELAADALAVQCVGGKTPYLRALAELALDADRRRSSAWLVPGFLSGQGILFRRIAMLRVKDDQSTQRLKQGWQWLPLVGIASMALAVSVLRAPLTPIQADSRAEVVQASAGDAFDLSLLPRVNNPSEIGAYAVRPMAILGRPVCTPALKEFNAVLLKFSKMVVKGPLDFRIEDVDYVLGRLFLGGKNDPGKRQIIASLQVVRMSRPVDWEKLRDQLEEIFKKEQWKGENYASLRLDNKETALINLVVSVFGSNSNWIKEPMCFWAPDNRTLIIESESGIKSAIEAKINKKSLAGNDPAGWDKVSRGFCAVMVNNPKLDLLNRATTEAERADALKDPHSVEYLANQVVKNTVEMVYGLSGDDNLRLDCFSRCATPEAAAEIEKHIQAIVEDWKRQVVSLEKRSSQGDPLADDPARLTMIKLVNRLAIQRSGKQLTVQGEVLSGFNGVLSRMVRPEPKETEQPEKKR